MQINYEYTSNAYVAKRWLKELPSIFAADFEVASRFTATEKKNFQRMIEDNHKLSSIYSKYIESDGLSHPSLTVITHLSLAWSHTNARIIICTTHNIRKLICNFLVSTDKTQIWHNSAFDFKHIYYLINSTPPNFIDTMFLAKCLLNNTDRSKARVSLKELMGWKYGAWGLSKDNQITLENMKDEKMLLYSATDTCATFSLYEDLKNEGYV